LASTGADLLAARLSLKGKIVNKAHPAGRVSLIGPSSRGFDHSIKGRKKRLSEFKLHFYFDF